MKKCLARNAKEVGMGNPAEETIRTRQENFYSASALSPSK
jgi:hypothetical protein